MDAILSLGVTGLVDRILETKHSTDPASNELVSARIGPARSAPGARPAVVGRVLRPIDGRNQPRPLAPIARKLRYRSWRAHGMGGRLVDARRDRRDGRRQHWEWLQRPGRTCRYRGGLAPWLCASCAVLASAAGIVRNVRVGNHAVNAAAADADELSPPTSPASRCRSKQRTDDRYELLAKFQGVLQTLGFRGIIVLVDQVDEPHLINGSIDQMRALLWPMLDNKFLKHPGIGFKLLLPIELSRFIDREDRDFYQRARLDKQNMIPSLEWTGERCTTWRSPG